MIKRGIIFGGMKRIEHAIARGIYFLVLIKGCIACHRDKACPFCGSPQTRELASKHFFEKLLRCDNCSLMFRYPKDKITDRPRSEWLYYYESKVSILPREAELTELKMRNFKRSTYDISDKITLIKKYVKEGKVLDFGSSWGHGLWQFMHEGFSGTGYEISKKRAEYGQKNLGIEIIHNLEELDKRVEIFDIIFADNVLEHIEDIKDAFERVCRLLKKGGYLFIIVPACSNVDKKAWKKSYAFGKKHCIAFDKEFFSKNLPSMGVDIIEIEEFGPYLIELFVIARKR